MNENQQSQEKKKNKTLITSAIVILLVIAIFLVTKQPPYPREPQIQPQKKQVPTTPQPISRPTGTAPEVTFNMIEWKDQGKVTRWTTKTIDKILDVNSDITIKNNRKYKELFTLYLFDENIGRKVIKIDNDVLMPGVAKTIKLSKFEYENYDPSHDYSIKLTCPWRNCNAEIELASQQTYGGGRGSSTLFS